MKFPCAPHREILDKLFNLLDPWLPTYIFIYLRSLVWELNMTVCIRTQFGSGIQQELRYCLREINKHSETLENSSNDLNWSQFLKLGSCQFFFFSFLKVFFSGVSFSFFFFSCCDYCCFWMVRDKILLCSPSWAFTHDPQEPSPPENWDCRYESLFF